MGTGGRYDENKVFGKRNAQYEIPNVLRIPYCVFLVATGAISCICEPAGLVSGEFLSGRPPDW